MAAAEARAVWQRTANRCFVQEDAKRAPKLACCQSSSTTNQVDAGPTNAADGPDHLALGFMPPDRNHSLSNLRTDTRWWHQLQPSYAYQKVLTYEQLKALEAEVETLSADTLNSTTKIDEVHLQKGDIIPIDDCKNCESTLDVQYGLSDVCMNKAPNVRKQEINALYSKNAEEYLEPVGMRRKYELMALYSVGCPVSKQANEFCLDPESPWIGGYKTEPWWRITDKDELASLVMKKSLNHIENCDLPPPQKIYVRRHPYGHIGCFESDDALASKSQTCGISNRTHVQDCPDLGKTYENRGASSEEGCSVIGSGKSSRDIRDTPQESDADPGKAQLMEALSHSQTRAREAEKAAKQAFAEKEHILNLFIRQASQLFAYKQLFQLLQLETKSISSLFPMVLPQISYKGRKHWQSSRKATKGKRVKRGKPRYDITKYAVAFALGLSLVGGGLLLGWTVGWMLPPF
ncbi:dmx-like protein 1 [Fagus crenata]